MNAVVKAFIGGGLWRFISGRTTDDRLVEFEYYKAGDVKKVLAPDVPLAEYVDRVHGYTEGVLRYFPNYRVRTCVVCVCANRGWECWEV